VGHGLIVTAQLQRTGQARDSQRQDDFRMMHPCGGPGHV
jgi:hypothetical protein